MFGFKFSEKPATGATPIPPPTIQTLSVASGVANVFPNGPKSWILSSASNAQSS